MLELSPGDLVSEMENNQEIARYLVINRTFHNQNAQYYYVEYNCIIVYYNVKDRRRPYKVGTWWIIDTINLNSNFRNWKVVVESGLSWEGYEREKKKA